MPTSYTDQFYMIDPSTPPSPGAALLVANYTLVDNDDDGDIDGSNDTIGGANIVDSYPGDIIRVQMADGSTRDIEGITFYLTGGVTVFTPLDGSLLESATFVETINVSYDPDGVDTDRLRPICFTTGTVVAGVDGQPVLIDDLKAGDMVQVMTNGMPEQRVLRWIGRRHVDAGELAADPSLRPVCMTAGALGNGLPLRDLRVSRQHRVMTDSRIAERMFGHAQVLLPAIRLTELPGVYVDETVTEVTYIHLLFDSHEIVTAEGTATESLFTGPEALRAVSPEARAEILAIFPELGRRGSGQQPARILPPGHAQRRLIERHLKNGTALVHE